MGAEGNRPAFRYEADWDSLCQARVPAWFDQERLGIFLHWGLYSIPAFSNEWYSRNMYIQGTKEYEHHIKTYGPHKSFGYKDFIPLFTAEKFDAEEWVSLIRKAGAGYICPVAEHHDGLQMYKSSISRWNAADMGPHRDLLGEWRDAALKAGLHFCTSSHRAEHWFFMGPGREFDSDIKEPMQKGDFYWPAMPVGKLEDMFGKPYPTQEYMEDWLERTMELVVKYQPELLYFDWWVQHEAFRPYIKKLAAAYYNLGLDWGKDVMICYKHDAFAFGSGIVEVERGSFAEAKPYRWQTDTAVANNSWCHTDSLEYKTSEQVISILCDVVSKNGNLLLNVGPMADGSIPEGDRKILEDLGRWMKINGEAIRGAKVWRKSMEGEANTKDGQFEDGAGLVYTSRDYRFTTSRGMIYAICMKCPKDGRFTIRSLAVTDNTRLPDFAGIIREVDILGCDRPVKWSVDTGGLYVEAEGFTSEFPVVIRVKAA